MFRQRFPRILAALIGGLMGAWLLRAATAAPATNISAFTPHPPRPLVIAHQGGDGIRPSNTLEAFRHAVALGADVLDSDIHLSKDGVIVVMHDETVNRTTDGTGFIREKTLAEIKMLDAGYKWTGRLDYTGNTFPYRGKGIQVPTLDELFAAFPDKLHNIEIKQAPPEIAAPLCAMIKKYNLADRIAISSFRQENILAFRNACPNIHTAAVEPEVRELFVLNALWSGRLHAPRYQSLQVPERSGGLQLLTPQFVASAHSRNLAVYPWTINTREDMQRMLALGVDGINTDFPDILLDLLGK